MEGNQMMKLGEKAAWISIIAYVFLASLKISVGLLANSEALSADGLNNSSDILVSVAVLIGLRISQKPPDKDHHYGHNRAETVAALVASMIMFVMSFEVLYSSIMKFQQPIMDTPNMIAAWTSLFCALVIYGVYRYNNSLAQKTNSHAVKAAAHDNRSDALVSLGAFVGIVGSQFGVPWLDPLTALIVGLLICKTAWDIFRDSTHALTDGFDEKELKKISKTIEGTPGVKKINDLKARVHGSKKLVDVTIGVDPLLNVSESHEITEHIEKRVYRAHKISHVFVHIEPF